MNNKRNATLVIFLTVILLGFLDVQEAETKLITNVPPDISSNELKAVVIEDFENATDWVVESTPRKNPDPKKDPVPELTLKFIDGAPSDLRPEVWSADKKGMEKKRCLGLNFRFRYPGYNSIHVLPPPEVMWSDPSKPVMTFDYRLGKEVQERAIQIPGRVKGLSIWVHGRGNDFYLETWVKDWKGEVHILKFGSINFVGWQPLKVFVPPYIPQSIQSYPQTKVLKIVRFVIRSTPETSTEEMYVFLDQLKVLTETFEVNFDGQKLHEAFGKSSKAAPPAKPGGATP